MARSARIYVPIDAALFDQDEILDAGERATYLFIVILCRIKQLESDGSITTRQVAKLNVSGWQRRLTDLLRVGLLVSEVGSDHYIVPGWSKWNELSYERAARLERDRIRKAQGKDSNGNPHGFHTDSVTKQASKQIKQASTPTPPPVGDVLAAQDRKVKGGK